MDDDDKEWLAILLHRFETTDNPIRKAELAKEMRELAEGVVERLENA